MGSHAEKILHCQSSRRHMKHRNVNLDACLLLDIVEDGRQVYWILLMLTDKVSGHYK